MRSLIRAKTLCGEFAKVLAVFVAFYLLQTQILEVRYDVHGRAVGLAQAQARSVNETRRLVEQAVDDSTAEVARAQRALEEALVRLEKERERVRGIVERTSRDLETELRQNVEREGERLRGLELLAAANAREIRRLGADVSHDASRMKERMLYPTVQLRGNGTVGSGVLIYSTQQPGVGDPPVYTTFVLTASHVVQEVLGNPLREGATVDELHVLRPGSDEETDTYEAAVVIFDTARDLALLRANTTRAFPYLAELATRDELSALDVFSSAYAVGCPLGNRPMPTLGEISSKRKEVGNQIFWMLTAPTFFGNSGGGIYERSNHRLVGISSMIYTYGKTNPTVVPHMGLFVPLGTVYDWLDGSGLGFVHEGRPVPDARRRDLVWRREEPPSRSTASASRPEGLGVHPATGPSRAEIEP